MTTINHTEISRCQWCLSDPIYIEYHDKEWGVPVHDDKKHFEFLILDAAQAGLSWLTVLKKRENYRKVFANFNPEIVANFGETEIQQLLQNPGIIRNNLKVRSAIQNAKAFLKIHEEFGSFDKFIWQFTDYKTIVNKLENIKQLPASSQESEAMSKSLKKRGFNFVGSTICYAYMQAAGMINDHLTTCFRYNEV
jgi:DNA-3-methyladenine glycosylase I